MTSCANGYTLGDKGHDGCPTCRCEEKCTTCETHPIVVQKVDECHDNCNPKPQQVVVVEKTHECTENCGHHTGNLLNSYQTLITMEHPYCHYFCRRSRYQFMLLFKTHLFLLSTMSTILFMYNAVNFFKISCVRYKDKSIYKIFTHNNYKY